ncbi:EexN family lipoprotein [Paraglaciecola sp. 20A4]|uniref:EexN family lipoprotein n=1 Tax=Paraglaciecola sp. 20A4 TaxID=2687288 RepID=UPI00140CC388|nr:EexN family lipoprotein [Paraglaciecola sp. 20A4]
MKKFILILPLVFGLAACGTPSVEDLVDDPELLSEILAECTTKLMKGEDAKTEECMNATEAQKQILNNVMKGLLGN